MVVNLDEQMAYMEQMLPLIQGWDDKEAIGLLAPPLRDALVDMHGSPGLKHPWVNQPFGIFVGQANRMLTAKVGMMRDYLDPNDRKLVAYLGVVVERPWRMSTIQRWWERGKLTVDELRECLDFAWTDTEMPFTNLGDDIDFLFHEAGFTTDDADGFAKLPDRLTLWRGGPAGGISWTLDREKAEWFADRFSQEHPVWEVEVCKSEALGYFSGRGESEVVLGVEVWDGSGPRRVR